jgi:hypothetical protein
VHLSDSYKACTKSTRYEKVQFALHSTGGSIVSGAISTVGAAGIMLTANIAFFKKFGAFIFLTIALSTVFSLAFYRCARAGDRAKRGREARGRSEGAKERGVRGSPHDNPRAKSPTESVQPRLTRGGFAGSPPD